jgi:hypothetical protein
MKKAATRRTMMTALLGLGTGTTLCSSPLDESAWRAYQAVEEAWIRDRYALVVEQCPECADAAALDLEVKLAELQRREIQFHYLSRHNPQQLRGGMWQLSWLPVSEFDVSRMFADNPAYKRVEQKIRRLNEELRKSAQYEDFHRAQTRLWKTPEYRSIHRRYSGRLQDLNRIYGGSAAGAP